MCKNCYMQLVDISEIYPQRTHQAGDISKGKIVQMHVRNHYIVHWCTLGFWKWFRWIQHPKKTLFRHLKLVCSSIGSKVMLRARMHIKRAQEAKACMACANKCFSHVPTSMSLCEDRISNIQNQVPHREWRSDSLELLRLTQTRLPEQHFFPASKIRQRSLLCWRSCTDSLPTPGVRKKWTSGASLWTNFHNSNTFGNHFRCRTIFNMLGNPNHHFL